MGGLRPETSCPPTNPGMPSREGRGATGAGTPLAPASPPSPLVSPCQTGASPRVRLAAQSGGVLARVGVSGPMAAAVMAAWRGSRGWLLRGAFRAPPGRGCRSGVPVRQPPPLLPALEGPSAQVRTGSGGGSTQGLPVGPHCRVQRDAGLPRLQDFAGFPGVCFRVNRAPGISQAAPLLVFWIV